MLYSGYLSAISPRFFTSLFDCSKKREKKRKLLNFFLIPFYVKAMRSIYGAQASAHAQVVIVFKEKTSCDI